eukprot:5675359-Amphidinium_carterae.1
MMSCTCAEDTQRQDNLGFQLPTLMPGISRNLRIPDSARGNITGLRFVNSPSLLYSTNASSSKNQTPPPSKTMLVILRREDSAVFPTEETRYPK